MKIITLSTYFPIYPKFHIYKYILQKCDKYGNISFCFKYYKNHILFCITFLGLDYKYIKNAILFYSKLIVKFRLFYPYNVNNIQSYIDKMLSIFDYNRNTFKETVLV